MRKFYCPTKSDYVGVVFPTLNEFDRNNQLMTHGFQKKQNKKNIWQTEQIAKKKFKLSFNVVGYFLSNLKSTVNTWPLNSILDHVRWHKKNKWMPKSIDSSLTVHWIYTVNEMKESNIDNVSYDIFVCFSIYILTRCVQEIGAYFK